MVAELLAIGTELLLGQIANTNAQYLSRQLSELGIDVYHHVVVGDNPKRIQDALRLAESRADIIITTGGLGPTKDDLSKETIADYYGLEMVRDEESVRQINEFFARRNRPVTENNYRQADMPAGATPLYNGVGTAPGCVVEANGKIVVILPGPPVEMQSMFTAGVKPYLLAKTEYAIQSRFIRAYGIGESRLAAELQDLIDAQTNPTIATYVDETGVYLRLTAKSKDEAENSRLLQELEEKVMAVIGEYVYGYDNDNLYTVLYGLLKEKDLKLAVAESCTGGMICSKLVGVPGISECLTEGVVTYSNSAKTARLGVKEETLRCYGAVSEETAREMVQGLLKSADIGIATTGIAGPGGGTETKPVGLVYVCVGNREKQEVIKLQLGGQRSQVILSATANAVYKAIRFIQQNY